MTTIRNTYGAIETNQLGENGHPDIEVDVQLGDPDLARITRLRLITDPGFPAWDVSYCHGEMKDGRAARVHLPVHQFGRKNLNAELIAMCKEAGVYGKGLGIFDDGVISKMYG